MVMSTEELQEALDEARAELGRLVYSSASEEEIAACQAAITSYSLELELMGVHRL